MDYKEVFLGAGSILRGSGAFIYFLIPEKWVAMPTYIPPEAYILKCINDYAWIMVGNTSMLLIPVEENTRKIKAEEKSFFELKVKVDDRRHYKNVDEWVKKERRKIEKSKSKELKEIGKIKVSGHEGAYIIWLKYKKRFGILGNTICEAFLSCHFYCKETGREIFLKIQSKHPEAFMSKRQDLLFLISSIGCHCKAKKNKIENEILFLGESKH